MEANKAIEELAAQKTRKVIGRHKYNFLKSLDLENINDENLKQLELECPGLKVSKALQQIKHYETVNTSAAQGYKPLPPREKIKREPVKLDKESLWKLFTANYFNNEGVGYSKSPESVENIKPLIYYFIGDEENFKRCKNVSLKSAPSLSKGLLIIGGYGNGKTSVLKALEASLFNSNVKFKGFTANEVVSRYEALKSEIEKEEFWKLMCTGTRYFDDLLTEREASNYGKVDLFKDILEKRYADNKRTYITMNYKDGTNNDLDEGLQQLGERYGSRVYDRLFKMFNIIEFKGKSFRK